jgi:phosphatidylinositol alpha-1,6-mannosyltransferase
VSAPLLAAITLESQGGGGGIAAACRLVWQVFRDEWGGDARLIELLDRSAARRTLHSGLAARVAFGLRLMSAQTTRGCPWVLFGHVALTKGQVRVPPPFRRPHAVFLYGVEAWKGLTAIERRMLAAARLRIAISRFTAERVAQLNPGIGPIVECPLALPISSLADPSNGTAGDAHPPAVVIVARTVSTERYKGHDQLLEAWPLVTASVPHARLIVVGEGDDLPRLKAKARSTGLDRTVTFAGFLPQRELDAVYRNAAVFAMPSRGEGFGLAYLEAMAHGLPCIGSIHDAAREVVADGVTGFLVDQSDVPNLAATLVALLSSRELRQRMGAEGRRRFLERFTYTAFRSRLVSLLEGAFERRASVALGAPSEDSRVL